MHLNAGTSRSLKSALFDQYEGGFLRPCSAAQRRFVVEPADLAAISGDMVSHLKEGSGTIKAFVTYSDGIERPVPGEISLVCGPLLATPTAIIPQITGPVLLDPDV